MGVAGAVETTDMEVAEKQFKVNFFGTVSVTQEVFKCCAPHPIFPINAMVFTAGFA